VAPLASAPTSPPLAPAPRSDALCSSLASADPDYQNTLAREVAARGLRPRYGVLRKGETFVWAASLLHGGAPIRNPNRTRLSHVSHYFFLGGSMEQTYWTPRTSRLSDGYITRKSFLGPWVQLKAFNVSQALPSEPAGLKLTPHSRLGVCNYPAVGYKQRGGNCCPRSHRKGLPAKRETYAFAPRWVAEHAV